MLLFVSVLTLVEPLTGQVECDEAAIVDRERKTIVHHDLKRLTNLTAVTVPDWRSETRLSISQRLALSLNRQEVPHGKRRESRDRSGSHSSRAA